MNVNYELYKVFLAVANSNTITEAAKKLYISQPAITKSIKKLENQLNITLFIRNTKGIKLTKEGTAFYNQIKPALEQLYNVEFELKNINEVKLHNIKIGTDDFTLQGFLTNSIKKFVKKNKDINIFINEDKTENLIKNILLENIDVAIVTMISEQKILNNNIKSYELFSANLCLACNNSIKMNDLNNTKIICNNITLIKNIFPEQFSKLNYIVPNNYVQTYELVKQNVGIGILPEQVIENNNLKIIKNLSDTITLYLIINSNHINNSIRDLKKIIVEEVNEENINIQHI